MVFTQPFSEFDLNQFNLQNIPQKTMEKIFQSPMTSKSPTPPPTLHSSIDEKQAVLSPYQVPFYTCISTPPPTIDTPQYSYTPVQTSLPAAPQFYPVQYGVEYMIIQSPTSLQPASQQQTLMVTTPPPASVAPSSTSSSVGGSGSEAEDAAAPMSVTQAMELVWHGEFTKLFMMYHPNRWTLTPTFSQPTGKWRTFQDSAKVRFVCTQCAKGWTSMKGRVVFWYYLDHSTGMGNVMFKLYGQQCKTCKNGKYEHAMWYPEEVVKVVNNIYSRVGQVYYGFEKPAIRKERRNGKPATMHDKELCQACAQGVCREK